MTAIAISKNARSPRHSGAQDQEGREALVAVHLPQQPVQVLLAGAEAEMQCCAFAALQDDVGGERDGQLVMADQVGLQPFGHHHDEAFGDRCRQVGAMDHAGLDAVAVGEAIDRRVEAGFGDACGGVAHQCRDDGLAALVDQCVGDRFGHAVAGGNRLLLARFALWMISTRSVSARTGEFGEYGQGHRLHVPGEAQGNVPWQLPGVAQAVREGLAHGQFDVLRHEADDVLGELQLCLGEGGAVDLARELVGHLGADRRGRFRQQAGYVGLGQG